MEKLFADQKGKVPNDMVKMYITTVKALNSMKIITIEKTNWRIIDNTFTGLKCSHLYATNNGII